MSTPAQPASYALPGTGLLAGEYPGDKDAEVARHKLEALVARGVRTFVDLTTTNDNLLPYAPHLPNLQDGAAVRHVNFPIPDLSITDPATIEGILDVIDDALHRGHGVYVHCWGGAGRTGLIVGCWLGRRGFTGEEALERVARHFATLPAEKLLRHPWGSPQTEEQRQAVRSFATSARRPPNTPLLRVDRARGCLLGGAVGDALGAPVEFLNWADITERFAPDGIRDFATAYGRIGAITDDTQMTLWTAEGVLRGIVRARERGIGGPMSVLPRSYLRWLYTQDGRLPEGLESEELVLGDAESGRGWLLDVKELHHARAPGTTCLRALRSMRDVSLPAENASKGCGGVMRVAPIGLIDGHEDMLFALGCEAARITHGHPTGWLAAGAFVWILVQLMRGMALEDAVTSAIERTRREPAHEETTAALARALEMARAPHTPSYASVEALGGGWIAEEALAIGVYAALVAGDDFLRGVCLAVNHSGDSDSTGSIAGQLLGALHGVHAIPRHFLERLELRDVVATVAEDLVSEVRSDREWWARYPGY